MTAITPKTAMITSPTSTFGERGRRRIRVRWKIGCALGPGPGLVAINVVLSSVISGHLPRARIDQHIDDVGKQVGRQHDQGDDDEDPLHQRVVEFAQRVEEMKTDPWIVEDDLNQDLAGDEKADRDSEVGDDRQQRVASRVPDYLSGGQALGLSDQKEV